MNLVQCRLHNDVYVESSRNLISTQAYRIYSMFIHIVHSHPLSNKDNQMRCTIVFFCIILCGVVCLCYEILKMRENEGTKVVGKLAVVSSLCVVFRLKRKDEENFKNIFSVLFNIIIFFWAIWIQFLHAFLFNVSFILFLFKWMLNVVIVVVLETNFSFFHSNDNCYKNLKA
jgi:hypothetical protein